MKKHLDQPWFGIFTVGLSIAFLIWIVLMPTSIFVSVIGGWLCGVSLAVGVKVIREHVYLRRIDRSIAEYKSKVESN
jgi:hypothetical protein